MTDSEQATAMVLPRQAQGSARPRPADAAQTDRADGSPIPGARSRHLRVLLVTEGSGGHLIPALQVAKALAHAGVQVKIWYAQRPHLAPLSRGLTHELDGTSVELHPITLSSSSVLLARVWQGGRLWYQAERCLHAFAPDAVAGFGGWISAPVIAAARRQGIRCLLHEQNVQMGRANQWLAPWVDRIAVSFAQMQASVPGRATIVTGLPVRRAIGQAVRSEAAGQFGFDPRPTSGPTLLVLGGSQGAQAVNRLMGGVVERLTPGEQQTWQFIHLTGSKEAAAVRAIYAASAVKAWIAPFLLEMEAAYALADLVIARAGASTIAELARCGTPAILIPYPHAGGHQRANAQLVEALGGGLAMEESQATVEKLLGSIRRIVADERLHRMMGMQMRALGHAQATERLAQAILELA